jgi:hypothetical protein
MIRLYLTYGAVVLAALGWAHYTGWSPGDITEDKSVPKSVRDNPGSYRSTYGGRSFTGAK